MTVIKNLKSNIVMFNHDAMGNNSYLITQGDKAFLIDPSWNDASINTWLKKHDILLCGILMTHGHFDHIGNAFALAKQHQCKVYVYEKERHTLLEDNLSKLANQPIEVNATDVETFDGNLFTANGFLFKVTHFPGHTPGTICIQYDDVIFTGDHIFTDSIGRSDFSHSNHQDMMQSLAKFFKTYQDDELLICPGHGDIGLWGDVKKNNPLLKKGNF